MPFLLTEAALEAHQKELEQEPQPVLLYGASSPRHSPQHQESPPPARGGFAGFFGSLVSSIGKRGVLGGSKLSAQSSAGCSSPLLKAPDVSQFSSFSHGSRLDRFLTDAAKSAIVPEAYIPGPSHTESDFTKTKSKQVERSAHVPQAQNFQSNSKDDHQSSNRRKSLPSINLAPIPSLAVVKPLPFKASSSSGNSRLNSASSLSSDDAIFNSSQGFKTASAQALLSASIQVPTLSEIRTRISMLDESRDKQPMQAPSHAAAVKPAEHKQSPSFSPHHASQSSAAAADSLVSPPYALLQTAPLTAISRSKWKQEAAPASMSPPQGGWHYRSVKMLGDSPDHQPQSLSTAVGTPGAPSWLKVDNSPHQVSSVPARTPSIESSPATNFGARSSRRTSLDIAPAAASPPAPAAAVELAADKLFVAESSAAAQRRARQSTFLQTQRLSPTKTYTRDLPVPPHHNDVNAKGSESMLSVTTSTPAVEQGHASHISPGQVFSSLKVGTHNVSAGDSGRSTVLVGSGSSTAAPTQPAPHLSSGHVSITVSSHPNTGASNLKAEGSALLAKETGHQLSLDLSERLERIQRTHHEQYEQQEKHQQQPEFAKSGLHFQRGSSLAPAIKPVITAGASPLASATPSSLVSDSLQEFVSKVDARSHAAVTRFTPSNPDSFSANAIKHKENPVGQSSVLRHEMDSLQAFVRDQPRSSRPMPKQLLPVQTSSAMAFPSSDSTPVQKALVDHIDSASPSLDELDSSKPCASRHDSSRDAANCEDQFDNSYLFTRDDSLPVEFASPFTRPTAFHRAPVLNSTQSHARQRDDARTSHAPSWLSPAVPHTIPHSTIGEDDDFVGTFSPAHYRSSTLASGARDSDNDDFLPSFSVSRVISQESDAYSLANGASPSAVALKTFRPVPDVFSSEMDSDARGNSSQPIDNTQPLVEGARYIVRDSQGIELLATALSKVHLPDCRSLSHHALNTLLTPILRKFDVIRFADKLKIPTLIAADLVQLAPFTIHFVVDDSGDVMGNKTNTNWNDAQALLQECVEFVSMVNMQGCTISFLCSSISQAQLKTKDQVAPLFARVLAAVSLNRFAAVRKPNVISAFQSKVFDPVFAASTPALVYVLSLHDSRTKSDCVCAEGMLALQRALDARIAASNAMAEFVRVCVVSLGQGTLNGCSALLNELRSDAILGARMTFVEDFERDAAVCLQHGAELTPHLYVIKLLLGIVDPNYVD